MAIGSPSCAQKEEGKGDLQRERGGRGERIETGNPTSTAGLLRPRDPDRPGIEQKLSGNFPAVSLKPSPKRLSAVHARSLFHRRLRRGSHRTHRVVLPHFSSSLGLFPLRGSPQVLFVFGSFPGQAPGPGSFALTWRRCSLPSFFATFLSSEGLRPTDRRGSFKPIQKTPLVLLQFARARFHQDRAELRSSDRNSLAQAPGRLSSPSLPSAPPSKGKLGSSVAARRAGRARGRALWGPRAFGGASLYENPPHPPPKREKVSRNRIRLMPSCLLLLFSSLFFVKGRLLCFPNLPLVPQPIARRKS